MMLTCKQDLSVYQGWDIVVHGASMPKANAKKPTRQDAYRRASIFMDPCKVCMHFDYGGGNQYQIMKTCRDCGKVHKEKA